MRGYAGNGRNRRGGGRGNPGIDAGIGKRNREKKKEKEKKASIRRKLDAQEKMKLSAWGGNRPRDELYLQYKAVFDNPQYYDQGTGAIQWPPNEGFSGSPKTITLKKGRRIDRYGYNGGTFTSPEKTGYENRSVAPGTNLRPYNVFKVVKEIEGVKAGNIAPWFDEPGGGIQYKMPRSVQDLLDGGFLERV